MESASDRTIIFRKVALDRGSKSVFAGLDLELREQRIGLIGNNGSGKSSLLRLINGLLAPDSGAIVVHGLDVRENRKRLPQIAGFLFQNPDHQIVFSTVGEEIAFGLRQRGMTAAEAKARTRVLLDSHHCAAWADKAVQELSEGQKQLVCIIAVAALEPAILLLDEPFSSLDLPTRHLLLQTLIDLPVQIVMASHDLEMLSQFNRIIWLDEGKVAGDGPPEVVLPQYKAACFPKMSRQLMAAQ